MLDDWDKFGQLQRYTLCKELQKLWAHLASHRGYQEFKRILAGNLEAAASDDVPVSESTTSKPGYDSSL